MYLIVGLGNPGHRYQLTRHNIGFIVVDALLLHFDSRPTEQFKSVVAKVKDGDLDVILAKPQTYMNLSGEAVQALVAYYKVPLENLLVIHDDIDQPFGQLRFQKNRGPGGHNGIRDIHEKLGTPDYARLKIGIGRPTNPHVPIEDFVLQNFSPDEEKSLSELIQQAGDAALTFVESGFQRAQNEYNSPRSKDGS